MVKTKIKHITLNLKKTGFVSRLIHYKNPLDILSFRKILTKEKAELIQAVKTKNPGSIYSLAKILKRDFKSVHNDIWLLHNFGVIEFKSMKRKSLKPILSAQELRINIKL